jgi:hypothetical protein
MRRLQRPQTTEIRWLQAMQKLASSALAVSQTGQIWGIEGDYTSTRDGYKLICHCEPLGGLGERFFRTGHREAKQSPERESSLGDCFGIRVEQQERRPLFHPDPSQ